MAQTRGPYPYPHFMDGGASYGEALQGSDWPGEQGAPGRQSEGAGGGVGSQSQPGGGEGGSRGEGWTWSALGTPRSSRQCPCHSPHR